jgi:hypothetical protein
MPEEGMRREVMATAGRALDSAACEVTRADMISIQQEVLMEMLDPSVLMRCKSHSCVIV